MTSASDMLAKYAPVARCDRRTFTKVKRGPKAVQWCVWCASFLKPRQDCPVAAIISKPRVEVALRGEAAE